MNRSLNVLLISISVVIGVATAQGDEQKWGDLSGRLIYDGEPPNAKPIDVTHDKNAFSEPIFDESVVVNSKNGGVANVVVYLLPKGSDVIPTHPSYEDTANAKVKLSMKGGRFEPHILLLRTSQIMTLQNCDKVAYNPKTAFGSNAPL